MKSRPILKMESVRSDGLAVRGGRGRTWVSLPEGVVVPFSEVGQTGEGRDAGRHQEPNFGNLDGNLKF